MDPDSSGRGVFDDHHSAADMYPSVPQSLTSESQPGSPLALSSGFNSTGHHTMHNLLKINPLRQEGGNACTAGRGFEAQQEFQLPQDEVLHGHFFCACRRRGRRARLYQGELFIFSHVMVFRSNQFGDVRTWRFGFEDVENIRKKTSMRLPNTIGIVHKPMAVTSGRFAVATGHEQSAVETEHELTSFFFSSRDKAFDIMVQQWARARPDLAADALRAATADSFSTAESQLELSDGHISGDSLPGALTGAGTSPADAAAATVADAARHDNHSSLRRSHRRDLLKRLGDRRHLKHHLFGGHRFWGAEQRGAQAGESQPQKGPDEGHNWGPGEGAQQETGVPGGLPWVELQEGPPELPQQCKLVLEQHMPCSARELAQVLLSDESGFQPTVVANEGSTPLRLPRWSSQDGGKHNERVFEFIYRSKGVWGTVNSQCTQQQSFSVHKGGLVCYQHQQRMPDLPTGVGKAFHLHVRWEFVPDTAPTSSSAAAAAASTNAFQQQHQQQQQQQQQQQALSVHTWGSDSGGSQPPTPAVTPLNRHRTAALQRHSQAGDATATSSGILAVAPGASSSVPGTPTSAKQPVRRNKTALDPDAVGAAVLSMCKEAADGFDSLGQKMKSGFKAAGQELSSWKAAGKDVRAGTMQLAGSDAGSAAAVQMGSSLGVHQQRATAAASEAGSMPAGGLGAPARVNPGWGSAVGDVARVPGADSTSSNVFAANAADAAASGDVDMTDTASSPAVAVPRAAGTTAAAASGADAATAGGGRGSGCTWRIHLGVVFNKHHLLQSKVTKNTFETAVPHYQKLVELATEWVEDPTARVPRQQVLPWPAEQLQQKGQQLHHNVHHVRIASGGKHNIHRPPAAAESDNRAQGSRWAVFRLAGAAAETPLANVLLLAGVVLLVLNLLLMWHMAAKQGRILQLLGQLAQKQ